MTVYLVRHGNYSNPDNIFPFHLPLVLSEEGIGQIQRVGEWFKNQSLLKPPIYTSPIIRCFQTAEIISRIIDSPLFDDERLIESYCPDLQGQTMPEDKDEKVRVLCTDPSSEKIEKIQKRMINVFDEKVKEGKDCILVSHGDPITSLYYHLMKMPLVKCLFDDEHLDN